MGGSLKAGRGGSSVPKLIHSVFPCLIHMLFAHNTSRLRTTLALELLVFASTFSLLVCQHYRALMFFSPGEASRPKSRRSGDAPVAAADENGKSNFYPSAHQVVLHPGGNSARNTSNLAAPSDVFKRSGMFRLMRLLLSGWHDQSPERIHQSPVVFITLDGSGENWHDCEFVLVKCWVIKSQRAVNKQIHSATLRHTNKPRRSIAHNGLW